MLTHVVTFHQSAKWEWQESRSRSQFYTCRSSKRGHNLVARYLATQFRLIGAKFAHVSRPLTIITFNWTPFLIARMSEVSIWLDVWWLEQLPSSACWMCVPPSVEIWPRLRSCTWCVASTGWQAAGRHVQDGRACSVWRRAVAAPNPSTGTKMLRFNQPIWMHTLLGSSIPNIFLTTTISTQLYLEKAKIVGLRSSCIAITLRSVHYVLLWRVTRALCSTTVCT